MKKLELLKDLINCPKGRLFKENVNGYFYHYITDEECIQNKYKQYSFTKDEVLNNPDWFKIYE